MYIAAIMKKRAGVMRALRRCQLDEQDTYECVKKARAEHDNAIKATK